MKRLLLSFALIPLLIVAQTSETPSNLPALRALVESMSSLKSQLDQESAKVKKGDEEAKKEVTELQQRLNERERDFESVATGVEQRADDSSATTKFDLTVELTDLLGPLMHELKQVTEQPREIERLRGEAAREQRHVAEAKQAIENVTAVLKAIPNGKDEALKKALLEVKKDWTSAMTEAQGSQEAARYRLNEVLSNRKSIWQLIANAMRGFVLTRGLNLVLAIVAFFLAFLGWRSMHQWVTRFSPWHQKGDKPFFARVLDVLYHATSVVIGTLAALTVLYTTGDWLLLGLAMITMLALLIAAKNGLPRYYAQARLLLNLGDVREGERVVVNGLPWQVRSLNLVTELHNPALQHGSMKVPIQQMTSLTSRPYDQGELWFPCKEGDWLQLSDGTFGKAVVVTSEFVQVVQLGGAHRTYTTAAFLSQNAINLTGGFRVTAIVKVHPEHRAIATSTIPDALREGIHEGLLSMIEPNQLRSLKVEFRAVIPNALEFDVTADFVGDVADKQPGLQRALQHYALATCNDKGWKLGA